MSVKTISAYQFRMLKPSQLSSLASICKEQGLNLNLKGSVILSQEGINCFIAGQDQALKDYQNFLNNLGLFPKLTFNTIYSDKVPFKRFLCKIKPELVPLGIDSIQPAYKTAAYIEPKTLKRWYDESKPMTLVDTRNTYEFKLGTFKGAKHLNIRKFRDFSEALSHFRKTCPDLSLNHPIVTFCTGGIRCEKAATYMETQVFPVVYQLKGGIIHYFKTCGSAYYEGECFVFDKRIAIDASCKATGAVQCEYCRHVITKAHFQSEDKKTCPACNKPLPMPFC